MICWEQVTLTLTFDPDVGYWKITATHGEWGIAEHLEDLTGDDIADGLAVVKRAFERRATAEQASG